MSVCELSSNQNVLLFIQVYRLLNMYSLIRPIQSNKVSASELLLSIVTHEDLFVTENKEKKEHFEQIIDDIFENSMPLIICDFNGHLHSRVDKYE